MVRAQGSWIETTRTERAALTGAPDSDLRRGSPGFVVSIGGTQHCVAAHPVGGSRHASTVDAARRFYADYLGLGVEEMNLGWVARYRTDDGRASIQVVTRDATSPVDSVLSVHVGDAVDESYAEAQRRGYEIVHPLTLEPWGVQRFFVRDPDGNVINVVSHSDD